MKKETTAQKVWRYLTQLAIKNQSNTVRVSVAAIAKHAGCAERSVQYAWRKLEGKVERIIHKGKGARYKNELNEYIIHQFCTHVDNSKLKVFAPIKNLKAFKDLKDLKAEEEKISTSHNASPEIHKIKKSASNDLPDIIKRNLPHLVQGYALTVVDYVLAKFKRRMHKITHLVSWIRGALANEQAIYDAIGFEAYKARGQKTERPQANLSAPKSQVKRHVVPNRHASKPIKPVIMPPVYASPVVAESDIERILAKAKLYEKEKDRLILAV